MLTLKKKALEKGPSSVASWRSQSHQPGGPLKFSSSETHHNEAMDKLPVFQLEGASS